MSPRHAPIVAPCVVAPTAGRGVGVFTTQAVPAGALVLRTAAIGEAARRDLRSVQVDWQRHVYLDAPGHALNHSCDPSAGVRDNDRGAYDLIALRDLAAGDEVTFDYGTTEEFDVTLSTCACGAARCRGRPGGFSCIDPDHPALRAGLVAGYLLRDRPRG